MTEMSRFQQDYARLAAVLDERRPEERRDARWQIFASLAPALALFGLGLVSIASIALILWSVLAERLPL